MTAGQRTALVGGIATLVVVVVLLVSGASTIDVSELTWWDFKQEYLRLQKDKRERYEAERERVREDRHKPRELRRQIDREEFPRGSTVVGKDILNWFGEPDRKADSPTGGPFGTVARNWYYQARDGWVMVQFSCENDEAALWDEAMVGRPKPGVPGLPELVEEERQKAEQARRNREYVANLPKPKPRRKLDWTLIKSLKSDCAYYDRVVLGLEELAKRRAEQDPERAAEWRGAQRDLEILRERVVKRIDAHLAAYEAWSQEEGPLEEPASFEEERAAIRKDVEALTDGQPLLGDERFQRLLDD